MGHPHAVGAEAWAHVQWLRVLSGALCAVCRVPCAVCRVPCAPFTVPTHRQLDVDVSADGNYMLTSSKGFNSVGCEGKLWDLRTQQVVKEYIGHEQDTVACRFVPEPFPGAPPMVVTASKDNAVRLWDRETGECLVKHTEQAAGSFTALDTFPSGGDASFVATSFASGVYVFNVVPDAGAVQLQRVAQTPAS